MQEITANEAFDKFRPYSFVFVIAKDKNQTSGMVCAWQARCSYDPPMFVISLSKRGHTHKLIRNSKEFTIAVPNKDLIKEVEFFGSTHGDKVDKFKETQIKTEPAKEIGAPLLTDATINFECKLVKEVDLKNNILCIGQVVAAHVNEDKKVLLCVDKKDGKRVFNEFYLV
jgi:flavin reductase (DIM6/NTAB) family NADH-FMN oxidoreductase RutF